MKGTLHVDRYGLFLAIVFGGLGSFTAAVFGIGVWLFRRNRRLPRLVKPRRPPLTIVSAFRSLTEWSRPARTPLRR